MTQPRYYLHHENTPLPYTFLFSREHLQKKVKSLWNRVEKTDKVMGFKNKNSMSRRGS